MEVQGNDAAQTGQFIYIDIVKCTGSEECRSDEEIKKYFASRYINLMSNQIRFDFEKYGEDAIIIESTLITEFVGAW